MLGDQNDSKNIRDKKRSLDKSPFFWPLILVGCFIGGFVFFQKHVSSPSNWRGLQVVDCKLDIPSALYGKTVLVTGAAGFIGMHSSLKLKTLGAIPIGLDNINSYYDPALKYMRIDKLKSEGITFLKLDLCDEEGMTKLFQDYHFDYVLHLAAQAGVRFSVTHPKAYVRANVECYVNLMETIVHSGQNPVISYASSSSVYGKNKEIPFKESSKIVTQRSVYGATKAADELLAHVYHDMYNLRITGLRFFTVYGTYGRPDMAYFSFSERIMNATHIKLYNYGNMDRDFTFVSDIVNGIMGSLAYAADFEIFNLGRGHVRNVMDLVNLLEENLGVKALLDNVPTPGGEVLTTYADTTKAERLLCYSPSVDLEQGIPAFMEWYKSMWLPKYNYVHSPL